MSTALRIRSVFSLVVLVLTVCFAAFAQMETATLSGIIQDPNGRVVPDVEVAATRIETGIAATTKTNGAGIYFFTGLTPGHYHLVVRKPGFKEIAIKEFQLYVQDKLEQNFSLELGSVSETVTVEAGALTINTQDATVSTVVDRHFAENLPMNGRSFQTLIQLTPGVVLTVSGSADDGQFSVNGQRATSNYWTVDGVSANSGASAVALGGDAPGGAISSLSVLGGTNSLVSVDAMQEFRIQTSTYAPEFGRTPGAQISIVTRTGTNQFHGTAFDYLRNDLFDANDWFADSAGLPKPQERQNDFGGTFSGPILKDRTFFFFSYEGLRLRLPQVALTTVPDLAARQNAIPAMQPFLNAYPLPNGPDNTATGVAQFNASFSNRASLDAYSIRLDHKLKDNLTLFGRYSYSPSELLNRGVTSVALSVIPQFRVTTHSATVGLTWVLSPATTNDLRFNYSRTNASGHSDLDTFGGAVPLASLPFPSPFTPQDSTFALTILSLKNGLLEAGRGASNRQQQINIVDALSEQKGSHSLKFGVDFRHLSPQIRPFNYFQLPLFFSMPSAEQGMPFFSAVRSSINGEFLLNNLGAFAQDTWRIRPRLTVTYGLRWDVDFAPSSSSGPALAAVTGFNFNDLSSLALAPAGTPPFQTTYGNVAPRVGIAYQLSQNQDRQTVLRGGFGVFYDLASSVIGNQYTFAAYPFGAVKVNFGGTFPLTPAAAAPPAISVPGGGSGEVLAFDPTMKLPYTLQWNVALEQGLGKQQTISATYIGSVGRRLIQTAVISPPNPNFASAQLVGNTGTSDYNALQLQFQRRLSHGLQALASYTWSHSLDDGSAGSAALVPGIQRSANRGPSDFDIRNGFSAGVTYDIPAPKINTFTNAILRGWSLQNVILVRSAPPIRVFDGSLSEILGARTDVRPDVEPGIPLYLFGSQYPGGKALNNTPGAVVGGCSDGSQSVGPFCPPPTDPNTGNPLREGNLGRNALRGFGATQWDFAVHREFPIHESLKLQFRAEMFNVLNHPNFGQPVGDTSNAQFGLSTQMLGRSLNNLNLGGGAFDPLYQIGGPRSIQLALKVQF